MQEGIPENVEDQTIAQAPPSGQTLSSTVEALPSVQSSVPSSGPNSNPLGLFPQGLPDFGSNASGGSLDFFRDNPQFQALQALIQANPQILQVQKLSFDDHISYFQKTKDVITLKIGKKASEKLCNEALFLVSLGSNDYINNFLQSGLDDAKKYTITKFEDLLINTLESQLTRLHKLGARKVVFHGLSPMGCIPSQRVKSMDGACLGYVNDYVRQFNSRVKNLIAGLNSNLPAAQMAFAEVNS